mmetsp:Transcript_27366/g.49257  ORF Transcript_27366/g.49257 Transcript_27366/m.49257 type:complete len:249 (+) Transcript_27366:95-841(+)
MELLQDQANSKNCRRRPWNPTEDCAIVELVELYGTKQWTVISDRLQVDFGIKGRSGKQCRERWHNHLDPSIKKGYWTPEETLKLFETHRVVGNKWADISGLLPGRSDNSIKNHFYSTMRKQYRKLFGSEATREQLREQDESLTQDVLKALNRKVKAKTQPKQMKPKKLPVQMEEEEEDEKFAADCSAMDLLITGTHLEIPTSNSMAVSFEEFPAEFSWLEYPQDLFSIDEVFILPWGFKPSDSYSVKC